MSAIDDLCPNKKNRIRDILDAVGIDTNHWTSNYDPKSYNWSFGGEGEPTLLCIWHDDLEMKNDQICYLDRSHQEAQELDKKKGEGQRADRARRFHSLLQQAYRKELPVRVTLVKGHDNDAVKYSNKTRFRELDSEPWYAHSFNEMNFEILLVRGIPRPVVLDGKSKVTPDHGPASLPDLPGKAKTITTTVYERDPEVSRKAKQRANGRCEYCKSFGFTTAKGEYYLETHHVIPLSCNGVDEEWNIAAICPNDHKRAHFGKNRRQIRETLINYLGSKYPEMKSRLIEMAKQMDMEVESDDALENYADFD